MIYRNIKNMSQDRWSSCFLSAFPDMRLRMSAGQMLDYVNIKSNLCLYISHPVVLRLLDRCSSDRISRGFLHLILATGRAPNLLGSPSWIYLGRCSARCNRVRVWGTPCKCNRWFGFFFDGMIHQDSRNGEGKINRHANTNMGRYGDITCSEKVSKG